MRPAVHSRVMVPSRLSEAVKAHLLALVEAQADITIAELRERIAVEQGGRRVGLLCGDGC